MSWYQLAGQIRGMGRQQLADWLQRFHQQTVDAVAERAADVVRDMSGSDADRPGIVQAVRSINTGSRIADDRMHLRRAEAVLWALRSRRALLVSREDVQQAYDQGHGVDISRDKVTGGLEVTQQPGKFNGE